MIYRIEIHQTETNKWLPQVWDGDTTKGSPLWEGKYYDEMEDAFAMAKYEVDTRSYHDKQFARLARLGPDDRPGESEMD